MKRTTVLIVAVFLALPVVGAEFSPGFEAYMNDSADDAVVSGILYLTDQVDLTELQAQLDAQRVGSTKRHQTVIEALQAMAATTQPRVIAQLDELKSRGLVEGYTSYWISNLIVVGGRKAAFYELAERVDVERIEVNFQVELVEPVNRGGAYSPDDNQVTPGVRACWADSVWYQYGITGAGRIIAGLDTGVDGNHPAFAARWAGNRPGWQWSWAWKDALGSTQFPSDGHGHGTHTMGTMCGLGAPTADTIGIAWGAWWIADNAIDQGVGSEFDNDVIEAFEWMADPDGDPGTTEDVPDVVQNSWRVNENFSGYVDCDTRWQTAIDGLEAAGCAVVYSAGNEGPGSGTIGSPPDWIADENTNFSVGATQYLPPYDIALFSSRGPSTCPGHTPPLDIKPEIVAPGVNIFSSVPGGGYEGGWSGTSMAGPHVSGVFALMREAFPGITVAQMKDLVRTTARDLGTSGNDNTYGYGIVNALACVEGALAMSSYGWVEGVVDDGTNPIQEATVTVVGYSTGTSNASGYYITMGEAGSQTLICEAFGYVSDTTNVSLITGDTITQNFTLTFGTNGTLEGTVTELSSGNPVANATLTLLGTPLSPQSTNASGFYQFLSSIPEGAYDLEVSHPFFLAETAAVVITPGGTTTQDFALVTQPTYTGPDAYGYYAYDYSDSQYVQTPVFVWNDIVSIGTPFYFADDMRSPVEIPFNFMYYGVTYDTLWACSNGWISFGSDPVDSDWSNSGIPDADGPPAMVALLWDDLNPDTTGSGDGYWYYDAANHTLTVQYDGIVHWTPIGTPETFQVVLYDPAYYPTSTGDGEIVLYYYDDWDTSDHTVGIENESETIGIQYYYAGTYDDNAAPLGASTCVKFTTNLPTVGVEDDDLVAVPSCFDLRPAYPNPFNPTTTIAFDLPRSSTVRLEVYNVLGQRVATLVDGELPAGVHDILWDASSVGSGVYFARITAGENTATTKMVLLK